MKPLKVTPRHAEVLDLLVEYGDNRLIARKMGLQPETIQNYITRMLEENGHGNRVTLAIAWERQRRAAA